VLGSRVFSTSLNGSCGFRLGPRIYVDLRRPVGRIQKPVAVVLLRLAELPGECSGRTVLIADDHVGNVRNAGTRAIVDHRITAATARAEDERLGRGQGKDVAMRIERNIQRAGAGAGDASGHQAGSDGHCLEHDRLSHVFLRNYRIVVQQNPARLIR
jgi:hypothetical protein